MLESPPHGDRQRGVRALVTQVGPAHAAHRRTRLVPARPAPGGQFVPARRLPALPAIWSSRASSPPDSSASTAVSRMAVTEARPMP